VPRQRTNPRLKTPSGQEPAASRGPFRIHAAIDNSVTDLDAEILNHDFGRFDYDLHEAMRDLPLIELAKRYPELTFQRVHSPKRRKPKGCAAAVERGGKGFWLTAKWRTAA
jgi:hypothetical protein